MIEFSVFPGGKKRILSFSYDDGLEQDARLIELFNRYGMKGSFNLNGYRYVDCTEEEIQRLRDLYRGHEVSCHGYLHGWPERMPGASLVQELVECRRILEKVFDTHVVGYAYPNASKCEDAVKALELCDMAYGITGRPNNFRLPENLYLWPTTCHHRDAREYAEKFLKRIDSYWYGPLFIICGHSHDFRKEEQWEEMEQILQMLAFNDKIWYATILEIRDYIVAQRSLRISIDEKRFTNPTNMDVWVEKDRSQIICIPAGQTVVLE